MAKQVKKTTKKKPKKTKLKAPKKKDKDIDAWFEGVKKSPMGIQRFEPLPAYPVQKSYPPAPPPQHHPAMVPTKIEMNNTADGKTEVRYPTPTELTRWVPICEKYKDGTWLELCDKRGGKTIQRGKMNDTDVRIWLKVRIDPMATPPLILLDSVVP